MIKYGHIVLTRKIFESEIFKSKPASWFKIFLYIVGNVNFKDTKILKRGEGRFTYKQISEDTGCTYDQVRECMRFLVKSQSVLVFYHNHFITIKLLNYANYQDAIKHKPQPKKALDPNLFPVKSIPKPVSEPLIKYKNKKDIKKEEKEERKGFRTIQEVLSEHKLYKKLN